MAFKISSRTVIVSLNIACIAGLIISVILAAVVSTGGREVALLALQTQRLSSELRQSSDDLTRFIRTYTVTNNASYWDYFLEVINIRNGLRPLPDEPWRNYWDLYISDGQPPRGFTAPKALRARMADASFTDEELALLEEAQRQSDALIDMEDVAYNAMNGRYRPSNTTGLTTAEARAFSELRPPNQTFAMLLVHSIPYHQWKGRIMRPIDDFASKATKRVEDKLEANFRSMIALIVTLCVIIVMFIVVLAVYFGKLAADSQTQHLLSSVLPERVMESITIEQFNALKQTAKDRARAVRKMASRPGGTYLQVHGEAETVDFPVLYSEYLPTAWVAFTDVVNFTRMCREVDCDVVIAVLNELFSMLDFAAARFGVEKIKTIGDAFMATKFTETLSDEPPPEVVAEDGIAMVRFLLTVCTIARGVARPKGEKAASDAPVDPNEKNYLELRAGLNVGPCASGIVGFERPLFDLFGDTVNAAARLEASGRPGMVHILNAAVPYFGNSRGDLYVEPVPDKLDLKGIGLVETCLITGIAHRSGAGDTDSMYSSSSRQSSHVSGSGK